MRENRDGFRSAVSEESAVFRGRSVWRKADKSTGPLQECIFREAVVIEGVRYLICSVRFGPFLYVIKLSHYSPVQLFLKKIYACICPGLPNLFRLLLGAVS